MIGVRKTITVIPNENILNIPPYYEETKDIHFPHFEMYNNFSRKYNLGYHFKSFEEPYILLDLGNILIESVDDFVICHYPQLITSKQYEELLGRRDFFTRYKHFVAGEHGKGWCKEIRVPVGYHGSKIDYFYKLIEECVNRGRK